MKHDGYFLNGRDTDVQEVFTVISNLVKGSPAAGYLLSLLQHLLLIRSDFFARYEF